MEIDFEKLFKNLAVEGSLLVSGVLSILISIYFQYKLGLKIGFLFLVFGGFLRFYRISILRGIFLNYLQKPKYRFEKKTYHEKTGKYIKEDCYRIPFKDSWDIYLFDFLFCLLFLVALVFSFILIIK